MEHLPLPVAELAPAARRAAEPGTPEAARMAAAAGLIALPPVQLIPLLYNLSLDPDSEAVRKAAAKSLVELPPPLCAGAVKTGLPPVVVDWLARHRLKDGEVVEAVLLQQSTYDETITFLAGVVGERQCEIVAANEVRLLRQPEIIEALYLNAKARMSTVQRCLELAIRQGIALEGLPAYKELAAAITGKVHSGGRDAEDPGEAARAQLAADAARAAAEAADGEDADLADANFAEAIRVAGSRPSAEELTPEERTSVVAQLASMTVVQKIRVCALGDKDTSRGGRVFRPYLVRDPNRLVALAAIKSPGITDSEVVAYAQSRAVSDDVIRHIALAREMQKSYAVKVALVNNPKCPLPTALRLLPMLRANDLKALSHNKNISQGIAEQARRLLTQKMK